MNIPAVPMAQALTSARSHQGLLTPLPQGLTTHNFGSVKIYFYGKGAYRGLRYGARLALFFKINVSRIGHFMMVFDTGRLR